MATGPGHVGAPSPPQHHAGVNHTLSRPLGADSRGEGKRLPSNLNCFPFFKFHFISSFINSIGVTLDTA